MASSNGKDDQVVILPDAIGSNPQGADDSREIIEIDDDSSSDGITTHQPPLRPRVRDSSGSTSELAIALDDSSDDDEAGRVDVIVPSPNSTASSGSTSIGSSHKKRKKVPFVQPKWVRRSQQPQQMVKEEPTPLFAPSERLDTPSSTTNNNNDFFVDLTTSRDSPMMIDISMLSDTDNDSSDDEAIRRKLGVSQPSPNKKMIYSYRRQRSEDEEIPESAFSPGNNSKRVASPLVLKEEEGGQQIPIQGALSGRTKMTARKTADSARSLPREQMASTKKHADKEYRPKNIFSAAASARQDPVPTNCLKDPPPTVPTGNDRNAAIGGGNEQSSHSLLQHDSNVFRMALKNHTILDVKGGTISQQPQQQQKEVHESSESVVEASESKKDQPSVFSSITKLEGEDMFIQNLRSMLDETEQKGFTDIISWDFHGKSILIRDKTMLSTLLLHDFFANTVYTHFEDKLLQCGFQRGLHVGPGTATFSHPHFLKAKPSLWQDERAKEREEASSGSSSSDVVQSSKRPTKLKGGKSTSSSLIAQSTSQPTKQKGDKNTSSSDIGNPIDSYGSRLFKEAVSLNDSLVVPPKNLKRQSTSSLTEEFSSKRNKSSPDIFVPSPNVDVSISEVTQPAPRQKRERVAKSLVPSFAEPTSPNLALSSEGDAMERDQDEESVDEEEEVKMGSMTRIEHLTSTTLCRNTGHPIHKFSVYGARDDVIYDFKVIAKKSEIPNAGMGAFLTFLGARRLKPYCKKKGDELFFYREHVSTMWDDNDPQVLSREPLQAVGTDGAGFSVTLAGENVYGEPMNPYILRPLKVGTKSTPRLKLFLTSSDNRSLYYEQELDGLNPTKESKGIGYLGIYKDEDYIPVENSTFSSLNKNCSLLDLGRYGPFRKQDRKTIQHFDIKSFIFSHEPSEWCFGAKEKLNGCEQMIDITDDLTGEPSKEAKQKIPMYVNEVGHNHKLKQTVFAYHDECRTTKYFVKIEDTMKKDDTVELLVNYKANYEDIRERKGYGLANLKDGVLGDDDLATRIQRNTDERKKMEENISKIPSLAQLYYLLEWLESIQCKLSKICDDFIENMDNVSENVTESPGSPTAQQLIALRRIQWLGGLLRFRLDHLRRNWDLLDQKQTEQGFRPSRPKEIEQRCSEWVQGFGWKSYGRLMNLISKSRFENLKDSKGKLIRQEIEQEVVEEACYKIGDRLPRPLAGSLWCKAAQQLTMKLGLAIGDFSSDQTTDGTTGDAQGLATTFIKNAVSATSSIRQEIAKNAFDNLEFDPGIHKDLQVTMADWSCFSGFQKSSSFFSGNSTTPKGYTASMVEYQAYQDAVELGLEPQVSHKSLCLPSRQTTIVTKNIQSSASQAQDVSSRDCEDLLGFPRQLKALPSKCGTINDTWYIIWQVVYIVDAFASKFLAQSSYSLEDLCLKVGVDIKLAQYAIKRGITIDEDYCKSVAKAKERKSQAKSRTRDKSRTPKASKKEPKAPGPPRRKTSAPFFWEIIWPCLKDNFGWTLDRGNRPNDFYALPPGVQRGRGFRNRIDFFDSVPLVIAFLENDPRWKGRPEVKKSLSRYETAMPLLEELRKTKKLPKFSSKQEVAQYVNSLIPAADKEKR